MLEQIAEPLLKWYDTNKRSLPWRDQNNAYYTWVSEIMLQQTRVEAVKPYFTQFVRELPDIKSLAECPQERLMKLWEGLGYYSRVRNMQAAAMQVMEQYGGELPGDHQALLKLKGIGSYTAGAIASIAFGIPAAAVDGNVLRVVSRLCASYEDITKVSVRKKTEELLLKIIPPHRPGDFNQALMELGAVVCVPNGMAKCLQCPLSAECKAYKQNVVSELPVKPSKKARTIENRTVLVIQDGSRTAIGQRPSVGLLAGLYELPNYPGHLSSQEVLEQVKKIGLEPLRIEALPEAKHVFSHIEWRMTGYLVRVAALEGPGKQKLLFVEKHQSEKSYAIPSAFGAYVKYMKEENK